MPSKFSEKETWYNLISNTVFGTSIVLSLILMGMMAGVYIYFTGPFPTQMAAASSTVLFVGNSISILLTIALCTYIHMGKYRIPFFIILCCILGVVIVLSGFVMAVILTYKINVADVDEYIKKGYIKEEGKDAAVRPPPFIDFMQKQMSCCGGVSYETYSNLTMNNDKLFFVPKSCCWKGTKICDHNNLLMTEQKTVYLDSSKTVKISKEVSLPNALVLWELAYKLLKESEEKGESSDSDFKNEEEGGEKPEDGQNKNKNGSNGPDEEGEEGSPYKGKVHYDIVKYLVSTAKVQDFEGQNFSSETYWMADKDAIPIKLFGCGRYLEDFENYRLGQPRSYNFMRAMRVSVKILAVLVFIVELAKLVLLLYCGLHFKKQGNGDENSTNSSGKSSGKNQNNQNKDQKKKKSQIKEEKPQRKKQEKDGVFGRDDNKKKNEQYRDESPRGRAGPGSASFGSRMNMNSGRPTSKRPVNPGQNRRPPDNSGYRRQSNF